MTEYGSVFFLLRGVWIREEQAACSGRIGGLIGSSREQVRNTTQLAERSLFADL